MNMTNMFVLGTGLMLAIAPSSVAETKPGWGEWKPVAIDEEQTFSAGFSNLELGHYLDFEDYCEDKAKAANTEPEYSYRFSYLLDYIGTGLVEYRCSINGQRLANSIMTAIKTNIAYPTCLQVQSDIGNGLNLRQSDDLAAPLVGILMNGSRVYQHSAPSWVSSDLTGRLWLFLQRNNQENVWVSLAEKEGAHVNFRLCS